jgi:hypothetical protein
MSLIGPAIIVKFRVLDGYLAATGQKTILRAVAYNTAKGETEVWLVPDTGAIGAGSVGQDRAANIKVLQGDALGGKQDAGFVSGEPQSGAVDVRRSVRTADR